jgi:predicted RNase H-like HicB family nuclease
MTTLQYAHWQHEGIWIGYLLEFPDYWTQGATHEELTDNLRDLYQELAGGHVPEVRRVAELQVT